MALRVANYSLRISRFFSCGPGRDDDYVRHERPVARDPYLVTGNSYPCNPTYNDNAPSCPTCPVHGSQKARLRRAVDLVVYGLCMAAAVASLVVLILEFPQLRSLSSMFDGVQAVVLSVFSVQLASHASWETLHGVLLNVIACCVICPVILLNIPGPRSDTIYQVAMLVLAIGWITLRFRGSDRARADSTHQGSTAVQPADYRHVGVEEEFQEGVSETFDSFTHARDVEMAVSTRIAD